jgi:hypothetical protein
VCPSCSRWFTTQSWLRAAIELVGYLTAALILAGFLIRAADSATAYVCLTAAITLLAFGALRPLYLLRNRRRNPLASNGDPARSPRER